MRENYNTKKDSPFQYYKNNVLLDAFKTWSQKKKLKKIHKYLNTAKQHSKYFNLLKELVKIF